MPGCGIARGFGTFKNQFGFFNGVAGYYLVRFEKGDWQKRYVGKLYNGSQVRLESVAVSTVYLIVFILMPEYFKRNFFEITIIGKQYTFSI